MSTKSPDDLEAVRIIADALKPFDANDQERIIRWSREKVGLAEVSVRRAVDEVPSSYAGQTTAAEVSAGTKSKDIKSFVELKQPQSDNQFAATVAYFYRFEAPETVRKPDITADDLQEATRLAGRDRFTRPAQTLLNAHGQGYFDKADRGHYALNTVGENLVAMALPQSIAAGRTASSKKRRTTNLKKRSKSKKK